MIKFMPLDLHVLGLSQRIPWKNKNAVCLLQISALVPEIFRFDNWVKYANEKADDVIHSSIILYQVYNRAIAVTLQHRPLTLWRLIVLQKTNYCCKKFCSHGNSLLSSLEPVDFNMLVISSSKDIKWGHGHICMPAGSCIRGIIANIKMEPRRWP